MKDVDASNLESGRKDSICNISAFSTAVQRGIASANDDSADENSNRNEMDSHADTCVAGRNMLIISDARQTVSVSGFSKELKAIQKIPIGTAATLYQHPKTMQIFCLIFHEVLFFGDRLGGPSLLTPNQMRHNGLVVEDVPKHLDYSGRSTHLIYVPKHKLRIPLDMTGIVSGFSSWKPKSIEECQQYPQIEMTSNVEWKPSSSEFADKERICIGLVTSQQLSSEEQAAANEYNRMRQINALQCITGRN